MRRVTIFDADALAKLKADHDRLRHEVRNLHAATRRLIAGSGDADSGVLIGVTDSSGIAARVGDTPGSGTVTLKGIDASGTIISDTRTITAYNISSSAVAANTYVQIKREWVTGKYIIDFEDCP